MAVFKDKWDSYQGDTWRVHVYYKDWQGKTRQHTKRGFATKKEALAYERQYLAQKTQDITMSFGSFVQMYLEDLHPQLKENTYLNKVAIIENKILPYFSEKELSAISPTDILKWQNDLLQMKDETGRRYAQTYLRTIQNQMNAIFNHAVKYYGLKTNPCIRIKKMGKEKPEHEMLFWTKDEYMKFRDAIKDKPESFYAFETLYWCGIRVGELLALTRGDFDLTGRKLRINKSYQKLRGEDYITTPKTEKSNRIIDLPSFYCEEMEEYFSMVYKCQEDTRLFNFTKSFLHHEMERGAATAQVKRIRIHDLRHSHVAYLISLGFQPIEIAQRLGHETEAVTMMYAHLYPSKQRELVDRLQEEWDKDETAKEENNLQAADTGTEADDQKEKG